MGNSSVTTSTGEDLGKITEVALDLDTGCVAFAVMSVGGILGVGAKEYAIPWAALSLAPQDKKFVLDMTRERLDNAPVFNRERFQEQVNRRWLEALYDYYEFRPYWMR